MKYNKLILVLIIIFLVCFSCSKLKKDSKQKKSYPDIVQLDYRHYIYKNSRKYITAKVGVANTFEKRKTIECQNMEAEIYNSKGVLITKINSDSGSINQDKKIFFFKGNVKIEQYEKKTTMTTEELKLDYEKNKLICDKEVKISKEDGSYLKTDKLNSDLREQQTYFTKLELKYFYEDNTSDKSNEKD
jgi:LPS export ABC transporter protein LptC